MHIVLKTKTITTRGADIHFDCPACKQSSALGRTEDRAEKLSMFGLIPLAFKTTTFVVCSACGREFAAKLKAADLATLPSGDVARYIDSSAPFLAKFLTITAALVCILPLMGLVVSVPALVVGWKHRGWIRNTALVATIISVGILIYAYFGT